MRGRRYTRSMRAGSAPPETIDSSQASRSIASRDAAANTPAPGDLGFRIGISPTGLEARSCATASKPPAIVSATSNARLPSAGEPHARALRRRRRRQALDDAAQLAGRVARQERAQRAAGLGGELAQRRLERRAQALGAEALRARPGAEDVAVVHERIAVGAQPFLAAVLHRNEKPARAQRVRERAARAGEPLLVGARAARRAGCARRRRCASARAAVPGSASPRAAERRRGRR